MAGSWWGVALARFFGKRIAYTGAAERQNADFWPASRTYPAAAGGCDATAKCCRRVPRPFSVGRCPRSPALRATAPLGVDVGVWERVQRRCAAGGVGGLSP